VLLPTTLTPMFIGPVQCQFVNFQGDDPEDDCVM
jgi:hypothetical protein